MSQGSTYTGENYRPGALKPITSPTELREATVRDYKRSYARMGADIDSQLLERMAISDLELVASHRRGIDASPNYKRTKPVERKAAAKAVQADPNAQKLKLKKLSERSRLRSWLNVPADQLGEKWMYMTGRLTRIAEGASLTPNMVSSLSTTEMPGLALRIRRVVADYSLRHRQSRHNPFTTATGSVLNEKDAFRKFRRMLEDICDSSSGHLGPWWVPK